MTEQSIIFLLRLFTFVWISKIGSVRIGSTLFFKKWFEFGSDSFFKISSVRFGSVRVHYQKTSSSSVRIGSFSVSDPHPPIHTPFTDTSLHFTSTLLALHSIWLILQKNFEADEVSLFPPSLVMTMVQKIRFIEPIACLKDRARRVDTNPGPKFLIYRSPGPGGAHKFWVRWTIVRVKFDYNLILWKWSPRLSEKRVEYDSHQYRWAKHKKCTLIIWIV